MLYRGQRPGWNDAGDPLAPCALPKGDLGRSHRYLTTVRTICGCGEHVTSLQTGANGVFADYNNRYNPAGGPASSRWLILLLRNNSWKSRNASQEQIRFQLSPLLRAPTPATLHCDNLLGILLYIHNDAEERSHHLFPGLIPVIHGTIGVGVELVVRRVVEVSVDGHLAPLGHLDIRVIT